MKYDINGWGATVFVLGVVGLVVWFVASSLMAGGIIELALNVVTVALIVVGVHVFIRLCEWLSDKD
jgi:hypothetical protein